MVVILNIFPQVYGLVGINKMLTSDRNLKHLEKVIKILKLAVEHEHLNNPKIHSGLEEDTQDVLPPYRFSAPPSLWIVRKDQYHLLSPLFFLDSIPRSPCAFLRVEREIPCTSAS